MRRQKRRRGEERAGRRQGERGREGEVSREGGREVQTVRERTERRV